MVSTDHAGRLLRHSLPLGTFRGAICGPLRPCQLVAQWRWMGHGSTAQMLQAGLEQLSNTGYSVVDGADRRTGPIAGSD